MGRWVANDDASRVASMRREDGRHAPFDLGIGFFPGGLLKHAIALDQRRAQAVRVFMQILQRHSLGADITGAEDVCVMPADADDFAILHLDLQAATGLAQGADAVVGCGVSRRVLHKVLMAQSGENPFTHEGTGSVYNPGDCR